MSLKQHFELGLLRNVRIVGILKTLGDTETHLPYEVAMSLREPGTEIRF